MKTPEKTHYQPILLARELGFSYYDENTTVDEWLKIDKIDKTDYANYPNARKAVELKNSKLFKALK